MQNAMPWLSSVQEIELSGLIQLRTENKKQQSLIYIDLLNVSFVLVKLFNFSFVGFCEWQRSILHGGTVCPFWKRTLFDVKLTLSC